MTPVHDLQQPIAPSRSRLALLALVPCWLAAIGVGFIKIEQFSVSPGEIGPVPTHWPGSPEVPLSQDKLTLLMFVHPLCPCSRASLHELHTILAAAGPRLDANILFFQPPGAADDWRQSATCHE